MQVEAQIGSKVSMASLYPTHLSSVTLELMASSYRQIKSFQVPLNWWTALKSLLMQSVQGYHQQTKLNLATEKSYFIVILKTSKIT